MKIKIYIVLAVFITALSANFLRAEEVKLDIPVELETKLETPVETKVEVAKKTKLKIYSYEEAQELALKEKKHIFVFFWASWCKYCVQFQDEALKDEQVITMLNESFFLVSIDVEKKENGRLVKKYRARALPSLVFLDEKSEMVGVLPGFVEKDTFKEVLNYVIEKEYLYKTFE